MARLQLDITVDRDAPDDGGGPQVTGAVRHEDGTEAAFVGWIGLLSLVQDAVSVDQRAPASAAAEPGS
jgi:hypothetical protein